MTKLAALAVFFLAACSAHAVDYRTEYGKKVGQGQQIGALGDNLAGDQVGYFTGALQFSQTDVSLPGNFDLPVSVGRRFVVEPSRDLAHSSQWSTAPVKRAFGDWDLDIPYMTGTFSRNNGWDVNTATPSARCSSPTSVTTARPRPDIMVPAKFWHGNTMHLPGVGDQPLLVPLSTNTNRPTTGGPYNWATYKHWWFSCLGATKNNAGGEAFLAQAPDGTKYYFDWLSKRDASMLTFESPDGATTYKQLRSDVFLLVTKIIDRFGNTVDFTYSNDAFAKLLSITASDGRTITLTYTGEVVTSISDGTRTWQYDYSAGGLTQVILPDASAWQFSLASISPSLEYDDSCDMTGQPAYSCYGYPDMSANAPTTGYIVHPSGARVDFTVGVHLQAGAANQYSWPLGLIEKTISGPGLATATWKYGHVSGFGDPRGECMAGACPTRLWTDILNPDGSLSRQLFDLEGKVLQQLRGSVTASSSSPAIPHSLRGNDIDIADQASPINGTVPVFYQESDSTYSDSPSQIGTMFGGGTGASAYLPTEVTHVEYLQGASFTRQVNTEDTAFRLPTSVTSTGAGLNGPTSSNTTYTKTILTTYQHDLAKWIIGQVSLTCLGTSGCPQEISKTEFDANSLPWKTYSFGVLQQTLTYDMATVGAKGTLSSVTDGLGSTHTITLASWKRGTPQTITFPGTPSAVTQTAQVNNIGNLDWVVDELGSKTCYGYDAVGRLNLITYTSEAAANTCNTSSWTATTRSFVPVAAPEYGLAAGHWKQTVQTGNGQATTYFDGRWQPVLSVTEDTALPASKSFSVSRYDAMGRKTFTSYAAGSLTTVNDSITGVRTSYDALGRTTQVQQDNGATPGAVVLNTTTTYPTGFKTVVTNPRNFTTTTSFQAFDGPSTDAPVLIEMPETLKTTISRQAALGKTLSITRSGTYAGNAVSAIRQYVYDANERLCKTINPESGAALVDYDAAGNIKWTADGTTLTTLTCNRASVTAGQKRTRTYDKMNRVTAVSTPGGTADVTTSYYADGAVNVLTAANPGGFNVSTAYTYNRRRLLTQETATNGAVVYPLVYAYNANAHLSTLTYPDDHVVGYSRDALGRATQVAVPLGQVYASGISYYPNGAISGFTYGNGIVHTLGQDYRKLPKQSKDAYAGTSFLDDTYVYDANGNVDLITDALPAGANNRSRDLGYDGLDRMIVADSDPAQWGQATYAYDPLDNLRVADQGLRKYRYTYDANNRLSEIKNATAASLFTFGYDTRGNTTAKTIGAGCASDPNGQCAGKPNQGLVFDSANRLSQVTGVQTYRYDGLGRRVQTTDAGGALMYWIYSQSGQVMYTHDERRGQNLDYIYLGNTQVATRNVDYLNGGTVTTRFQHTDALGSPVLETDPGRVVLRRNSYAPYGEALAPTTIDGTGYTGHVMDQTTGLTYMQQRYYDPQIGRVISVDPAESEFNRYNYASNNPYRFTDPDGRVSNACGVTGCETGSFSTIVGLSDSITTVAPAAHGGGSGDSVASAAELRARYGRGTEGTGHHWVPFGSTTNMDLSPEARDVFGQTTSGEKIPSAIHNTDHGGYNDAVRKELASWSKQNRIDPARMTSAQARAFVSHVRGGTSVPRIRTFVAKIDQFNELVGRFGSPGFVRAMYFFGFVQMASDTMSINSAPCVNSPTNACER